jgi:preprotein translocase subunit SecD
MSDKKDLFKNPRVIIFILILLGSIVAIHPAYTPGEGITTNLNFGLDLEGGSWLQIKLEGALAQIDVDSGNLVSGIVEPIIGAPVEVTKNTLTLVALSINPLRSQHLLQSVPRSLSLLER